MISAELLTETRQLALDMVRLEMWARDAQRRHHYVEAGDLWAEREQVREHRSELLRQAWATRVLTRAQPRR